MTCACISVLKRVSFNRTAILLLTLFKSSVYISISKVFFAKLIMPNTFIANLRMYPEHIYKCPQVHVNRTSLSRLSESMIVNSNDAAILSEMPQFPYDICGQKKNWSREYKRLRFNALNTSLEARDWLFCLSKSYDKG